MSKMILLELRLTEPQYLMLQDCIQTAETKFRFNATDIGSENTMYANRIKALGEMVDKTKKEIEE